MQLPVESEPKGAFQGLVSHSQRTTELTTQGQPSGRVCAWLTMAVEGLEAPRNGFILKALLWR